MGKIVFFTGGARSGKSKFAEEYIKEKKYRNKIYFATAIPFDDEMKDRVKKHIDRRGKDWKTIEAYKNIVTTLEKEKTENHDVILFDCITNMVSNLMIMDRDVDWDNISQEEVNKIEKEIINEMQNFLEYLKSENIDCIFVTNELGMGLVPSYALGRYFRDICGNVNQMAASFADEAYLIVSGIKIKIK
ncbi:bifunctional adenosylcobinamide kinase/adenosylcobinamide-phosphate guanylyltransferase [Fusobacterium sp.]|uniref:bifunctional adenosylcobinamide kinase/adenosylcobinamide-phosphate guanylyltransferase n=1 Tax=Fusobacterium sp. TaxID=68766 RepID=UPI0025C69811|nr:bifunctional adenosylcobinamide kinase/adenosylcobinamide-phosphate guanylyltransferase [Fusobacterium sp.]MCI5725684.1 bifunctional adenosylcobinamide kinase/adenosylcobinamide-phosphate guanylyltransferase [Fusobacterium sp.]